MSALSFDTTACKLRLAEVLDPDLISWSDIQLARITAAVAEPDQFRRGMLLTWAGTAEIRMTAAALRASR